MRYALTVLILATGAPALAADPVSSDTTTSAATKNDSMAKMQRSVKMEIDAVRKFVTAAPMSTTTPGTTPSTPGTTPSTPGTTPSTPGTMPSTPGTMPSTSSSGALTKLAADADRAQQQLDSGRVYDAYTTLHQSLDTNKASINTALTQSSGEASRQLVDHWVAALQTRVDELRTATAGAPMADVQTRIDAANRLRGEAQRLNAEGNAAEAYRQVTAAATELDQALKSTFKASSMSDPLLEPNERL